MGLMGFFRRKAEPGVAPVAQSMEPDYGECLTEIGERLRRIENRQKEMSLQLEEIDTSLHSDGSDENALVETVITLADTIEDFYRFAADGYDSPLFEQALMMWNAVKSAAFGIGLEMIECGDEPFDFHRNAVESMEYDDSLPIGYVIKTLKCGYIYKDQLVRRAAVVVNKAKTLNEEM